MMKIQCSLVNYGVFKLYREEMGFFLLLTNVKLRSDEITKKVSKSNFGYTLDRIPAIITHTVIELFYFHNFLVALNAQI